MEAFYWLCQLHSYRRVAERLSLTQPAVSARINALEEDLNVQLIERDSQHFRLTEHGQQVAEYAEMFANLHEAMSSRLDERRQRHLAVGMVSMVTTSWGILMRDMVARAAPNVLLDIHSGSNRDLRRLLRAGVLDLAFLTDEADLSRVPNSFTVQYDVGWVGHPDLLRDLKQPLQTKTLRQLPIILYPPSSPLMQVLSRMLHENRARPNVRHVGNSLATISEMVRRGYGISAVALSQVEEDIISGRLELIETTETIAPLDICCVHLNRARKTQVQQIFEIAETAAREWCETHPRFLTFKKGPAS
ncbi:LysR family transcriptional regulator [Labrenzia sp. OB1]|uniref:LysR family transcriptional regulator n=1 Tax=Labrenzia sp. OB1 TaxID=1561204 RepID=UPI001FCB14C4|nr:LysR family transcriptional regulator [Labrenzia sp. OB1]